VVPAAFGQTCKPIAALPYTVTAPGVYCVTKTLCATEFVWATFRGRGAGLVVLAFAAWGLVETRVVVRPDTVLATEADHAVLAWVAAQTPPDATFLVDVKPWMGVWRGADGGWWIMPFTGRRTVLPPLAYTWGPPEETDLFRASAARGFAAVLRARAIAPGILQVREMRANPCLRSASRRAPNGSPSSGDQLPRPWRPHVVQTGLYEAAGSRPTPSSAAPAAPPYLRGPRPLQLVARPPTRFA
jgi:hypothetical protein